MNFKMIPNLYDLSTAPFDFVEIFLKLNSIEFYLLLQNFRAFEDKKKSVL